MQCRAVWPKPYGLSMPLLRKLFNWFFIFSSNSLYWVRWNGIVCCSRLFCTFILSWPKDARWKKIRIGAFQTSFLGTLWDWLGDFFIEPLFANTLRIAIIASILPQLTNFVEIYHRKPCHIASKVSFSLLIDKLGNQTRENPLGTLNSRPPDVTSLSILLRVAAICRINQIKLASPLKKLSICALLYHAHLLRNHDVISIVA